MKELGFLGLGKMGGSILEGVLSSKLYDKKDISFYAPSDKTKRKGLDKGINLANDEIDLFNNSRIIILAIEPQRYDEVLSKLKDLDSNNKIIISLAPGKTINNLKSYFVNSIIVRAMPNTPALINKGVTTLAFENNRVKEVVDIFSSIGICVELKEEEIDKAIPLQGSMPAYIFTFVQGFVECAKEYGIEESIAKELALHAIIGSCELALNSKKTLDELIDSVCSKGGATIAGLDKMKEEGFIEAIKSGYESCVKRSLELSR